MSLRNIPWSKLFLGSLVAVAAAIPVSIVYRIHEESRLANAPVDVLTNWTLKVDANTIYRPGDTVSAVSSFTKLMAVKGESERSVQCVRSQYTDQALSNFDADHNYKVPEEWWDAKNVSNETTGTANQTKKGQVIVNVGVPLSLGKLPNICRVYVSITYNINKYHPAFVETNGSNPFRMEQRPGIVTPDTSQTFIYNDRSAPNQNQSSIYLMPQSGDQVIITQESPQQPQPEDSPPTTDNPGLIQRILGKVGL